MNEPLTESAAPRGLAARLLERTIHPGTTTHGGTAEEVEWLQARQGRVTATMAKELVRGGAAARKRVVAESFVPPAPIVGNRYIDRGHEREPVIAAWIRSRWEIEPNTALVGAVGNERHACTPDGIGIVFDETDLSVELVLAEIKTSKHDLDPDRGYFAQTGYLEQMQWQMHVTGARRTLFVWEQHDDAWPNPMPLDLEPRWHWIERDEELIERMVAAADQALAERDRIVAERLAGGSGEDVVNVEIEALALAVLDARVAKSTAEARLAAPWNRLHALLAGQATFAQKSGLAAVTWNTKETRTSSIDEDAVLDAEVVGLPGVVGRELLEDVEENERALAEKIAQLDESKALAAARKVWESHRGEARFVREKVTSKASLTVTQPKAKKGQER